MPATFDADRLRAQAETLVARARRAALVLAVVGFVVAAPLGGVAAATVDGLRRVQSLRTHDDLEDAAADKRSEVRSVVRHVPLGFVAFGLFGALVGFVIGRQRGLVLRVQAESALCLLQIESNTRR